MCIRDRIQHNRAYEDIQAPKTIQARYVTEDVPMSLVPISTLGWMAQVPTPNIDAVIQLTSTIYGREDVYKRQPEHRPTGKRL